MCKIKSISGSVLTVSNKPTKIFPADYFSHATAQIISLPHFKNVTLNAGVSLKPVPFANGRGGVVAFKCSGTFKLNGGHVDLRDAGLNFQRTLTKNVEDCSMYGDSYGDPAQSDNALYAGWANGDTVNHFTLQKGDGACFIIAKKFTCHEDSRLGNPSVAGVAYCTGAHQSRTTGSFGQIGGSTLLIAAETISDFNVKCFAKYHSGRDSSSDTGADGIARCYIATETAEIPVDEALYSRDVISTPDRLQKTFNVKDFGDGSDGSAANITAQINNYARITDWNDARNILTYTRKTTKGTAKFKVGSLVLINAKNNSTGYVAYAGFTHLARIVGLTSTKITIDDPLPTDGAFNLTRYEVQIVTVPQYTTFRLTLENSATIKYVDGRGGIFAIACNDTCTIDGGKINVMGKGGGNAYGKSGLKRISNAGMCRRLPVGQGHGSVFILAKNLTLANEARLGATYRGDYFGGYSFIFDQIEFPTGADVGHCYGWDGSFIATGTLGGCGSSGGVNKVDGKLNGGYGSNAASGDGLQGAHVLIIADKLTGFNVKYLSTGGQSSTTRVKPVRSTLVTAHGGAGYGGGGSVPSTANEYEIRGGFIGGGAGIFARGNSDEGSYGTGGGSSGFAFMYVNQFS